MPTSWKAGLRKHWIAVTLYLMLSLFFLGAAIDSARTYSSVVGAQDRVVLANAFHEEAVLANGTILTSFKIDLVNPTEYDFEVASVTWYVKVYNESNGPSPYIQLGRDYTGPTEGMEVPASALTTLDFQAFVSDPITLMRLQGFINYSKTQGTTYTLYNLPYTYELSFRAFMKEFKHDYFREQYLNDLVMVDLFYSSREAT